MAPFARPHSVARNLTVLGVPQTSQVNCRFRVYSQLMRAFYSNLMSGKTPAAALRRAARNFRSETRLDTSTPITGEPLLYLEMLRRFVSKIQQENTMRHRRGRIDEHLKRTTWKKSQRHYLDPWGRSSCNFLQARPPMRIQE